MLAESGRGKPCSFSILACSLGFQAIPFERSTNRHFKNQASAVWPLNPLVSLFGRLVARSGRKRGNRQTDGRTDGRTDGWTTCCSNGWFTIFHKETGDLSLHLTPVLRRIRACRGGRGRMPKS